MHIPIKVDYAVIALIDICIYSNKIPARTSDIAKRTYIPKPYLSQVLLTLKKNGLIKSYRGPKGGHILAKNPSEITLEIIMNSCERSPPMGPVSAAIGIALRPNLANVFK